MKKIIKLTESDLSRIVRRVIKESYEEELDESWLSKLFGGGKEEKKPKTQMSGKRVANGAEVDYMYSCPAKSEKGEYANETVVSCEGKDVAFVSSHFLKKKGYSSNGTACSCGEAGFRW